MILGLDPKSLVHLGRFHRHARRVRVELPTQLHDGTRWIQCTHQVQGEDQEVHFVDIDFPFFLGFLWIQVETNQDTLPVLMPNQSLEYGGFPLRRDPSVTEALVDGMAGVGARGMCREGRHEFGRRSGAHGGETGERQGPNGKEYGLCRGAE